MVWKNYVDLVSEKNPQIWCQSGVRKYHTASHGQGLGALQMTPLGDSKLFSTHHPTWPGFSERKRCVGGAGPLRPLKRNTKEEEQKPGECGVTGSKRREHGRKD